MIRHKLVDIKLVLRWGTAWFTMAVIGILSFWLILVLLHSIFNFQLDLMASFVATAIATGVAIIIFKLRGQLFVMMNRAFQGPSYDYQQRLGEFIGKIHNVFSLKEQGGELLGLLIRAINVEQACFCSRSEQRRFRRPVRRAEG